MIKSSNLLTLPIFFTAITLTNPCISLYPVQILYLIIVISPLNNLTSLGPLSANVCGMNLIIYLLCACRRVVWLEQNTHEAWSRFIFMTANLHWTNFPINLSGVFAFLFSELNNSYHLLSKCPILLLPLNSIMMIYVTTHLTEEIGADWTSIFLPPHSPSQLHLDHTCCLPSK